MKKGFNLVFMHKSTNLKSISFFLVRAMYPTGFLASLFRKGMGSRVDLSKKRKEVAILSKYKESE